MLLEVSELSVFYAEHEIVRNENLSLDEGEILAIVCDEATSALDVSVQEKIMELLVRIQ